MKMSVANYWLSTFLYFQYQSAKIDFIDMV